MIISLLGPKLLEKRHKIVANGQIELFTQTIQLLYNDGVLTRAWQL